MNKYLRLCAALLLCAILCGCASEDKTVIDTDDNYWRVGFGCEVIVPADYNAQTDSFDSTLYIAGYKNDNPAAGMLDPQCARATYISDGDTSIILAAVDCVGLAKTDIDKIKSRVSDVVENMGIDSIHIASTHTHAGIDTLGLWGPVGIDGKNDAFMDRLTEMTARAIKLACLNAREGKLYYGTAETVDMQRDSRTPNVYSTQLRRIRFAPSDGAEGLQIIGYDAHAEALRSENSKVSADYPCYMGRKIKAESGDDFIFFAGAVGGLIMTERMKDEIGEEYTAEQNVVVTGERLADYALSITDEIELTPIISVKSEPIKIQLDNSLYVTMAFLGVLSHKPVMGGGRHSLALESSVTAIKLGELNIATIPGEIFPELVYGGEYGQANPASTNPKPLTEIFGDDHLFTIGLCDDEIGYIIPPSDFYLDGSSPYLVEGRDKENRKHYEETNSVSITAAVKIAEAFSHILK